jgi:hypothetical protein
MAQPDPLRLTCAQATLMEYDDAPHGPLVSQKDRLIADVIGFLHLPLFTTEFRREKFLFSVIFRTDANS